MNKYDYALLKNKKRRNQQLQKQISHNQKLVKKEEQHAK